MSIRTQRVPFKALIGGLLVATSSVAMAGGKIQIAQDKWISLGAGLRTAFTANDNSSPSGTSYSKDFAVQEARLYIAGQINKDFKFTFNTKNFTDGMDVLDAVIQYEPNPAFNLWLGRILVPADRIEMNGPFYGLSWNQYTVPLYPSDNSGSNTVAGRIGRDDGVTVWGTLNKFQYAVGIFDGYNGDANQDDNLLYTARLAYNFLNKEDNPAFYTSSTYYGGLGDIFTVAVSGQSQSDGGTIGTNSADFSGYAVDVLFEKPLSGGNVVTAEGEYKSFNTSQSSTGKAYKNKFSLFDGNAYFATVAFLVGSPVGPGKFQPYLRYTSNEPNGTVKSSDLSELGVNYVIDGHNLRFNASISNGDANLTGTPGKDVTHFSLGMQVQI